MHRMFMFVWMLLLAALPAQGAQETKGTLTANGQSGQLRYAAAFETDSRSEPGYMDVVVVISDRQLPEVVLRNQERLEEMARNEGLVGLRVVLNPDAKVMSAEPLHRAFTTFVSSALWIKWEPLAFDEKQIAGHVYTNGLQDEFGQKWQYDIHFSAPILLDAAAKSVPVK